MDESFTELYERYVDDIYRFAVRFTGDMAEAEDLTAETFVRAYHGWTQLLQPDRVRSWLFRIAHNICIDAIRRRERRNHVSLSDDTAMEVANLLQHLAADARLPSESVVRQEIADFLQAVLLQLPVDYRTVIVLGELEETPNREIADIVGRSIPAVKSLRQRARKALRDEVVRALRQRGTTVGELIGS